MRCYAKDGKRCNYHDHQILRCRRMSELPARPVVFLPSDEFGVERVFPIRSLVGDRADSSDPHDEKPIEPQYQAEDSIASRSTASTSPPDRQNDGDQSSNPAAVASDEPTYAPPPYPPIPPKETIRRLSLPRRNSEELAQSDVEQARRVSERAQLVPSTFGPPGVLSGTSTDSGEATILRCEDEPIHVPGAIQSFGALIVVKYDQNENLQVRIASENTAKLLKYSPEELFELLSFLDVLESGSRDDLVARIRHALSNVGGPSKDTHLDVLSLTIISAEGEMSPLWCAIHVAQGSKELVILEFEKFSDNLYLGGLHDKNLLPLQPTQTIDDEVAPEIRLMSITSGSEPLRVLEIARRREQKIMSSMDMFNAMTQAQQQLASSTSVQSVMDRVVGLISELSGFHRVMFYRFDSEMNGCVEAELVDPHASSDIFRGLHFPASDIPQQARDLYVLNKIRLLYDRDEETARLVCRDVPDFEQKLDLTHSYLRAMSPIHLKYLGNMGVRSSMSVSIVINGDLWGLIACHGYGDFGLRVTLPIRELCRNIGECASTNIQRLIMMQRINARRPPSFMPNQKSPSGFIAASSGDLLRLFDADFGMLSIQEEARAIGRLDPYREALAILTYLQARRFTSIMASQNIAQDFTDLKYPPGIKLIAGILVIPLSMGGNDFLVFFRKGQLNEVRWAGNPYEKLAAKPGGQYLEPRSSFKRWTETVIGVSKEWSEDQMDTAAVLSLLYGRFIEIWRQKESAGNTNRMTRLLIQNSAHEVRTPLNAIVNYLEMALENTMEEPTREILAKAHKASRSLIYVIDDLLNLTKAEDGRVSHPKECFDLGATVSEVITAFRKEALRKGLDLTVSTHQGIPEMVKGDPSRLRQVLSNVTSNAFQHSAAGGIKVDIRPIRIQEQSSVIGITVQDLGLGMSETQLDDLFLEFEQVMDEDSPSASATPPSTDGGQPLGLGLGLAVVARYVRNMNGQIRVRSELGKGTIFGIELPFEHASGTPGTQEDKAVTFSRPPRPLSAAEIVRPRDNSDSSNSTVGPPSTGILKSDKPSSSKDRFTSVDLELETLTSDLNIITSPDSELRDTTSSLSSPVEPRNSKFPFPDMGKSSSRRSTVLRQELLKILIAEDNPINAKLLTKRLEGLGHKVEVSYDGQECHDYFASKPHDVDVILMDLQMPLVDGDLSTRMIRHFEQEIEDLQKVRPRVPIIAVSASLTEDNRYKYVESGFDGWILKPIDFKRLDFILQGIKRPELKREALYTYGQWEFGGWFLS